MLFNKFDSEDSNETLLHVLGWYGFMIFFLLQSTILIATTIAAWVILIRLLLFLRPLKDHNIGYGQADEVLSDTD